MHNVINRTVLIILLLFVVSGASGQSSVFGPEGFTRTPGEPNVYTRQFSTSDASQTYTILVENGVEGNTRVTSASIWVNDLQLFGPDDFKRKVGVLFKQIRLNENNNLRVRLSSNPSSSLRITVNAPFEASATLGSGGGTIEVANPASPIYGTRMDVPAGAIPEDESPNITINFSDQLPGPLHPDAVKSSKVIHLNKTMPYNFTIPISVTIPLDVSSLPPSEMPVVFFWNPQRNKYLATTVTSVDRVNKTVTFRTNHFEMVK